MSGCNSGIYSAGRMLYTLGVNGQAPKFFAKVSNNGVPLFGTFGVIVGLAIGVVLSYIAPENLFRICIQCQCTSWYDSMVCHFN